MEQTVHWCVDVCQGQREEILLYEGVQPEGVFWLAVTPSTTVSAVCLS